jgi:hypothetical protein
LNLGHTFECAHALDCDNSIDSLQSSSARVTFLAPVILRDAFCCEANLPYAVAKSAIAALDNGAQRLPATPFPRRVTL